MTTKLIIVGMQTETKGKNHEKIFRTRFLYFIFLGRCCCCFFFAECCVRLVSQLYLIQLHYTITDKLINHFIWIDDNWIFLASLHFAHENATKKKCIRKISVKQNLAQAHTFYPDKITLSSCFSLFFLSNFNARKTNVNEEPNTHRN